MLSLRIAGLATQGGTATIGRFPPEVAAAYPRIVSGRDFQELTFLDLARFVVTAIKIGLSAQKTTPKSGC